MITTENPPAVGDRPRFPEDMAPIQTELDGLFKATPLYATLGIEVLDWGLGWAKVGLQPSPSLGNLAGSLHGGVTFSLADASFEIACNSYGRASVALETTCHYHKPGPVKDQVIADAWESARGHRTASYRLQVSAGDRVIASYMALAYRTSRWHIPQDRFPEGWG